jgi:hypothetical protein
MENTYATIKLQILPYLLTPASTREKVPHSIFETNSSIILNRVYIQEAEYGLKFLGGI